MARFPPHPRSRHPLRFRPELQPLEGRTLLSAFTMTSPTGAGELPEGVTAVGGIVLDFVGENGRRVVSQVAASTLFVGNFSNGEPAEFEGNPGTIGVRDGFSSQVLDALGGGLAELSVRLTVFDGDSGPGDFDREDNTLLLNGIAVGRFDAVATVETDETGTVIVSENPDGGFRDKRLDTGFFHVTDPEILARVYLSIRADGSVAVQLLDEDPFDNFFYSSLGVDASLIAVDLPPAPRNEPPRIDAIDVQGPASEGSPFRVVVSASDPDPGETLSYVFMIEGVDGSRIDGSPSSPEALVTVPRDGSITLIVRVLDSLGASDEQARSIVVRNVAPIVSSPGAHHTVEGSETVFSLGSFEDPGLEDGWKVVVDWGDGSPAETFQVDQPGRLPDRSHGYAQDGDYVITVRVDDGTGAGTASSVVRVRNAPPRIERIEADRRVDFGDPVTLSATVSDPGRLDRLSARIDWGDGTASLIELPESTTDLQTINVYGRPGEYAITFTVFDDGGGASTVSLPVAVVVPEVPRLPGFRLDRGPEPPPLFSGDDALAAALLPAEQGLPDFSTIAFGPTGTPDPPPPTAAEPPGVEIGTLVGQSNAGPNPRPVSPSPTIAPLPSSPADNAELALAPTEVASAEAQTNEAVAIASAGSGDELPAEDIEDESPSVDESVTVAAVEAEANAPPSAAATADPAGSEGSGSGSKAMRATVVLIAVLTVRRGESRLRQSRMPGARRPFGR